MVLIEFIVRFFGPCKFLTRPNIFCSGTAMFFFPVSCGTNRSNQSSTTTMQAYYYCWRVAGTPYLYMLLYRCTSGQTSTGPDDEDAR